ncbi:TPA: hypothetical protein DF272_06765 [Candidatus Falkowbacteria bacterium]|nr:hypothetical protein [Candidatus Falkowbacteria bacterium]
MVNYDLPPQPSLNNNKDVFDLAKKLPEEEKTFFEIQLELLVTKYARKVNEGNNGIICYLDVRSIKAVSQLVAILAEHGIQFETEQAMKILKVYKPGSGRYEFEQQMRAYDLIKQKADPSLAQVPKPILFYELPITPETKSIIESMGVEIVEDKVELILMDFIPGVDIATMLYREVAMRHPKLVHLQDKLEELSFSELQRHVFEALELKAPGGKGSTEGERAYEERLVSNENEKNLYEYLERDGYVFPETILNVLSTTIEWFHQNNFYLRDFHHRNAMVVDNDGQPSVYILDFGLAASVDDGSDPYTDKRSDAVYLDDFAVIRSLEGLSESKNEKQEKLNRDFVERLSRYEKRLVKNQSWQSITALHQEHPFDLDSIIRSIIQKKLAQVNTDTMADMIGAYLLGLFHRDQTTKSDVIMSINNQLKGDVDPILRKTLTQIKQAIR